MKYKLNINLRVCVCLTDVQALLFFNQNTRLNVTNVLHLMPLNSLIMFFLTIVLAFDTLILLVSVSIKT